MLKVEYSEALHPTLELHGAHLVDRELQVLAFIIREEENFLAGKKVVDGNMEAFGQESLCANIGLGALPVPRGDFPRGGGEREEGEGSSKLHIVFMVFEGEEAWLKKRYL